MTKRQSQLMMKQRNKETKKQIKRAAPKCNPVQRSATKGVVSSMTAALMSRAKLLVPWWWTEWFRLRPSSCFRSYIYLLLDDWLLTIDFNWFIWRFFIRPRPSGTPSILEGELFEGSPSPSLGEELITQSSPSRGRKETHKRLPL